LTTVNFDPRAGGIAARDRALPVLDPSFTAEEL